MSANFDLLSLAPHVPRVLEFRVTDLAEPLQHLVKGFSQIPVGRVGAIAQDKFLHRFPAIGPAVALLEPAEERFLVIVGGRQAAHALAGEQAPPAGADGLDQVLGDRGVLGLSSGRPL